MVRDAGIEFARVSCGAQISRSAQYQGPCSLGAGSTDRRGACVRVGSCARVRPGAASALWHSAHHDRDVDVGLGRGAQAHAAPGGYSATRSGPGCGRLARCPSRWSHRSTQQLIDLAQVGGSLPANSFGFSRDSIVVSVVGRLTGDLEKAEGVKEAAHVVGRLAKTRPVYLLVVGSGPEEASVREIARGGDHQIKGRDVVAVVGELIDPRPAYDCADVVIGMGSSALKGMAFGKPLVVQGSSGFWCLAEPSSVDRFLHEGWYGHGGQGQSDLEPVLERLVSDPALRRDLGSMGRVLVDDRYSLESAIEGQRELYSRVSEQQFSIGERGWALTQSTLEWLKFRTVCALRVGRRALEPRGSRSGGIRVDGVHVPNAGSRRQGVR